MRSRKALSAMLHAGLDLGRDVVEESSEWKEGEALLMRHTDLFLLLFSDSGMCRLFAHIVGRVNAVLDSLEQEVGRSFGMEGVVMERSCPVCVCVCAATGECSVSK